MSKLKRKRIDIPIYAFRGGQQFLPYPLPPGRKGAYRIETHIEPAGKSLTIVSIRNAIFMGLQPQKLALDAPTTIHKLRYHPNDADHGVWMTTQPQEIEQHQRQLSKAHGHVLLGGLGLGLAVGILQSNEKVKSITVVEKAKDVIDLVAPHLPREKELNVIHADLFAHLLAQSIMGDGYDFAFYDIWAPTGQTVITSHTLPLRRLSRGLLKQDQIECWNEEEMIGQVATGIISRMQFPQLIDPILTMPAAEFAPMRKCNREVFPFMNWLRQNQHRPDGIHAKMGVRRYLAALKNGEAWERDWEQFDKPIRLRKKTPKKELQHAPNGA